MACGDLDDPGCDDLRGGIFLGGVPSTELAAGVMTHGVEAAVPLDEETVMGEVGHGLIARAEQKKDTEQGDAGYAPGFSGKALFLDFREVCAHVKLT